MSSACIPILVVVVYPVSETYGVSDLIDSDHGLHYPWSSKNLIDRNRPEKFMLVGIDVKCMYTNFGGRGLSSFGDIATFKNGQISPSDHGL